MIRRHRCVLHACLLCPNANQSEYTEFPGLSCTCAKHLSRQVLAVHVFWLLLVDTMLHNDDCQYADAYIQQLCFVWCISPKFPVANYMFICTPDISGRTSACSLQRGAIATRTEDDEQRPSWKISARTGGGTTHGSGLRCRCSKVCFGSSRWQCGGRELHSSAQHSSCCSGLYRPFRRLLTSCLAELLAEASQRAPGICHIRKERRHELR